MKTLILDTATSLTAHGVTLTIERHAKGFGLAAGNYRATIPVCGCERTICAGRCPAAGKRVAEKDEHRAGHCHGDGPVGGMHLEHVKVFAERVLKTFGPEARKPFASGTLAVPGLGGELPADIKAQLDIALAERKAQGLKPDAALRVPNVGAPQGSAGAHWLPLDGEETVSALHATDGKWVVQCNAIRCRDEHGYVTRLSEWESETFAESAAERHRAWHRGGVESAGWTLRLTVDEIEVGDWYYTGFWHRIATKQSYRTGPSCVIWGDDEQRIATLDTRYRYLIVRGEQPDWTPSVEARRAEYVR